MRYHAMLVAGLLIWDSVLLQDFTMPKECSYCRLTMILHNTVAPKCDAPQRHNQSTLEQTHRKQTAYHPFGMLFISYVCSRRTWGSNRRVPVNSTAAMVVPV